MIPFLKTRLGAMMFLQYVIWGAWYVTLNTYLTSTLKFSGTEAGAVFGTTALASLVAPFLVGLVADRLVRDRAGPGDALCARRGVPPARDAGYELRRGLRGPAGVLPVLFPDDRPDQLDHDAAGRGSRAASFPASACWGPSAGLSSALSSATCAWKPARCRSCLERRHAVVMCVYSLMALPHTPPRASGQKATVRSVLGLDALAMLKDPTYLVFVIASVLACIPLTFYYSFTNAYLNEVGVVNAAGKMTLGQVSEIGMMLLMPFVFRVATVRWILLVGLLSWAVRYVLLAYGDPGPGVWMFYLAIIMHGVCFDFFFVTGQLYTDQEAPPHLRSTAQGFITAMTYGVGMLVGSLLSGGVLDYFSTTAADGAVTRDWSAFWLTSAGMSFVIMLLVLFFFRTTAKIRAKEAV